MEHAAGEKALLFLILALAVGAAVRHLLRRSKLPYTVALLVVGLLFGLAGRMHWAVGPLASVHHAIEWAATLDPKVILFLFLPPLIFESAFSLDVHLFRRSFTQIFLLAAPGLLISTGLIALLAKFVFPFGWDWQVSLMFGALMSATDPVAVVALLRELGAGKRLATLIEGESLLNDGTAIVVFLVFYSVAILGQPAAAPMAAMGKFAWVAIGGPVVGLLIAAIAIEWIRRVFNDALVEITLTIVAAYLTYFVAEELLHVSGVLALVALGLLIAGIGRTRISTEVEGFLHRFWEMTAYLANTIIFILVGVVIAAGATWGSYMDWLMLAVLYIGIHVARGAVVGILFPLMKRVGYGMTGPEATVLTWGGLRGAVGLCLALVVAQKATGGSPAMQVVGEKVLFLCAGIVVLTLVVNGMTIGKLLSFFGMDQVLPARLRTLATASDRVHADTQTALTALKGDRFLSGADWERVRSYVPEHVASHEVAAPSDSSDLAAEARRRILGAEKRSYWRQFHEGLLSPGGVRRLVESVNWAQDRAGSLADRKELERLWELPPMLLRLRSWPLVSTFCRYLFFDRLALGYDVARGFVLAQEEIGGLTDRVVTDKTIAAAILKESGRNRDIGLAAVQRLREAFPEIVVAIETKMAARSVLNYERGTVHRLLEEGVLDEDEAERWVKSVESRMKQLFDTPPAIELPSPRHLLGETPWLDGLSGDVFDQVLAAVKELIYAPGQDLVRRGDRADGMFVIARGSVKVFSKAEGKEGGFHDVLGPGSVIGEMAVLTGAPRSANVQAETPVQALWINNDDLHRLMAAAPELKERLWRTAGARFAENMLIAEEQFCDRGLMRVRRWLVNGQVVAPEEGSSVDFPSVAILLGGTAVLPAAPDQSISAPAVIREAAATFQDQARLYICPALDTLE